MRVNILILVALLSFNTLAASCGVLNDEDSIRHRLLMDHPKSHLFKRPVFIGAKYSGGKALTDDSKVPTGYIQYTDIRVGVTSVGNRWKDIVYGMPYYGIGMGFHDFNSKYTGHPITAYLFQGGTLRTFSPRSSLKYEWNFGASFNWKEYDPVTNPENKCIGKRANIYFAANLYFIY